MPMPEALQEVLDTLAMFPDKQDRIQTLIAYSEQYQAPPKDIAERPYPEANRVPGCESEVFVWVRRVGEGIKAYYAVDNPQGVSAMALCAILDGALSGKSPDEIQEVPDEIVYEIFGRELSMGKSMGLMGIVRMTKALAKSA
ncbi:MAG: SufE family protein [Fimbriimonadaceae bacterium]|nr:SufE family protein [Fimbriimonadaceae bacterium]